MEKEERQYSERIVAFVDMMGVTDLVKKILADEQAFLDLLDAFEISRQTFSGEAPNFIKSIEPEVTTFSDSIIISFPRSDAGFWSLTKYLSELIENLFEIVRIPVRGGVTVGKAYHKSGIAFGPAVVEAYRLETEVAIVPRIVISKTAMELLTEVAQQNSGYETLIGKFYFHDDDMCFVMNPFSSYWIRAHLAATLEEKRDFSKLIGVRSIIIDKLLEYSDNPKILEKYIWYAGRYNHTIEKCKKFEPSLQSIDSFKVLQRGIAFSGPTNFG